MTSSALEFDLAAPGGHQVVEHADVTLLCDLLEQASAIEGDPGRMGELADAERIDQLQLLERIKATAATAQARITVEFETSQLQLELPRHRPAPRTPHRRDHHAHGPHLPVPGAARAAAAPLSRRCPAPGAPVSRRCAVGGRPHLAFSHA